MMARLSPSRHQHDLSDVGPIVQPLMRLRRHLEVVHPVDPRADLAAREQLDEVGPPAADQLGRPGEVWGAESGADRLIVFRYESG